MNGSRIHLGISADVQALLSVASPASILREHNGSPGGRPLAAAEILALHPEFAQRKSLVLDLAYEEFCQRLEAGEAVEVDDYCRHFGDFEESLRRLLAVHEFFSENPHLFPSPQADWPCPGQVLEGFSVIDELGRGAFARVYLAEEIELGNRLSVVKVSADGTAEARILGKLHHPNIVPIHSVRQDPQTGRALICMPYLGSVTLFDVMDRLRRGGGRPSKASAILEAIDALSQEKPPCNHTDAKEALLERASFIDGAVSLACRLAEGLTHSHAKGICHCDLKPSNVLLTPGGRPMLLDFNLAFDPQAAQCRLGGTLAYMAPEQVRALIDPQANATPVVDERSDIFSLGVMLYEMVAGRFPYPAVDRNLPRDQLGARLLQQQQSGPCPLRTGNAAVDPALADLVERCLAFAPEKRPQSTAALAEELRQYISPMRRARRWLRRHSRLALSTAALCLVSIAVGVSLLLARPPYPIRQLNQGMEYYARGEFAAAEEYFSRAIEADRDLSEAYFWRARTLERDEGRRQLAIEDYKRAATGDIAAQALACRAYCFAMEGFFDNAIIDSVQAIEAGMGSAEVYNNLGYCYLRKNLLPLAREALDKALQRNPSLRRALYNRAMTELRWNFSDKRHPIDPQAANDIDQAIEAGPPIAAFYLDAAQIFLRLEGGLEQHRDRIARYLDEALRLGIAPETIRREFPTFSVDESVSDKRPKSVSSPSRTPLDRLADPLPDHS